MQVLGKWLPVIDSMQLVDLDLCCCIVMAIQSAGLSVVQQILCGG